MNGKGQWIAAQSGHRVPAGSRLRRYRQQHRTMDAIASRTTLTTRASGLTYQANPSTVIRAGYGRSFDIGVFGSIFGHAATQNLPRCWQSQSVSAAGGDTAIGYNSECVSTLSTMAPAPECLPDGAVERPAAQPGLQSCHARGHGRLTLRLPTLDAWNAQCAAVADTPTLSADDCVRRQQGNAHSSATRSSNTDEPERGRQSFLPGGLQHYGPARCTTILRVSREQLRPQVIERCGILSAGISTGRWHQPNADLPARGTMACKLPAVRRPELRCSVARSAQGRRRTTRRTAVAAGTRAFTYYSDSLDTHLQRPAGIDR